MPRFKIGDGVTNINDLDFFNAATEITSGVQADWDEIDPMAASYIQNKIPIENGEGEYSIFMGEESKALDDYSIALGKNSHTGAKGYKLIAIEATDKIIVEEWDDQVEKATGYKITVADEVGNKASENYAIGDILCVDGTTHDYHNFKISDLESNGDNQSIITVGPAIDGSYLPIMNVDSSTDPWENWVWVAEKPEAGTGSDFSYATWAGGEDSTAIGRNARAFGRGAQAIGNYAYAEGRNSRAEYLAHAEGLQTKAIGHRSHTEGNKTEAHGNDSHAEGSSTRTFGIFSHAEGYGAEAYGEASHSEGASTISRKLGSHAEGVDTIASQVGSHSEGRLTEANGLTSHAEGYSTLAEGDYSHSEGTSTRAKGRSSHAEGGSTFAVGNYSHSEGAGNNKNITITGKVDSENGHFYKTSLIQDTGDGIFIMPSFLAYPNSELYEITSAEWESDGYIIQLSTALPNNISYPLNAELFRGTAVGNYSHSEGYCTSTNGDFSHSEGYRTYAFGKASHTEGVDTKAGNFAHAEGNTTKANGNNSHAEGSLSVATGVNSHAEGYSTESKGNHSHAEGHSTQAIGGQSHAEGASTQAIGGNSHAEGNTTVANGGNSHAEGVRSSTGASASGAHAEGYQTQANGSSSHAEGSSSIATGVNSHAEGNNSKAVGGNSHAEGSSSEANGGTSHAEGYGTKADGQESHAQNHATQASGNYSHAEGQNSKALKIGSHAEGYYTQANGEYSHSENYKTQTIGNYSHAEGNMTIAKGENSHTEGQETLTGVNAIAAHAEGYKTQANGNYSHVEGNGNIDNGENNHIEGYNNKTVLTSNSHIEGQNNYIEGFIFSNGDGEPTLSDNNHIAGYNNKVYDLKNSHIEGKNNKIYGGTVGDIMSSSEIHVEGSDHSIYFMYGEENIHIEGQAHSINTEYLSNSHMEGKENTIGSDTAYRLESVHVEGYHTKAFGNYSHVNGNNTIAQYRSSTVIGEYNKPYILVDDDTSIDRFSDIAGDLFVVGNGQSDTSRSNAFRIHNTNGVFGGTYNSTGADYAEYFEWADGNPNKEDRIGLLVTLDGEKIKLANDGDEILGVISGNGSVIGDSYDDTWQGMYLRDVYGRYIIEEVELERTLSNGETETYTQKQLKVNPDYNPEEKYIPRSQRPEWDAVGLLGKLYVYDDGTAIVNGYVKVDENGMATYSSEKTNMRVLSRINKNVIRVFLKN